MDLATLAPLVSPPVPSSVIPGLFDAFDENRDGHIDFKEMACGISAAARGPLIERQKFTFKIFDGDKDGLLSVKELEGMVAVMKSVLLESYNQSQGQSHRSHYGSQSLHSSPDQMREDVISILTKEDGQIVQEILKSATTTDTSNGRGGISLEEYLVWSLSNPLPEVFLTLIYQVRRSFFQLEFLQLLFSHFHG